MTSIGKTLLFAAVCVGLSAGACAAPAPGAAQTPGQKDAEVAARVGDRTITLAEVDATASKQNSEVYQQLYTARRQALEEMIANAVVEKEAAAGGVSADQLLAREVDAKLPQISDAQVQEFYEQNKARMGNQTLEQMADRIRQFITTQNAAQVRNDYIAQLKKKHGAKIALEPPRVDVQVAANDPSKGPANAPILLVEFSEFQ